jgi:hypothetical protein
VAKKTRRGQKQCPKCQAWVKGTRAKNCPKCGYAFKSNGAAVKPAPAAVPAEKPASTVTLDHVKAVAKTVKTIGGFNRLNELLGVVKEVGGLKKFKDLMEAMSVPEADQPKV